jgi:hypothetical protein
VSSFDGPDMSLPAQAYATCQQIKTIRRCDGTNDFRPLTGAYAIVMKESPSARFMAEGLPGLGDNEAPPLSLWVYVSSLWEEMASPIVMQAQST